MSTIRWRVEELVAQHGWTVRRLADEAGLDQKTVRNIVSGRATRVDLETIERLSQALGVRPGALWQLGGDPRKAWEETTGAAGRASVEESNAVLSGRWSRQTDPALERALRSS